MKLMGAGKGGAAAPAAAAPKKSLFGGLKPTTTETAIDEKVGEKVTAELEKQYASGLQFRGRKSGLGFSD